MRHFKNSKRRRASRKKDKDKLQATIVVKPLNSWEFEVYCYDPQTGREIPVHKKLRRDQVESKVSSLKSQLERAGNYVVVKEM